MHIHILWRGIEYNSTLQEICEAKGHTVVNRTISEIALGELEHPAPDLIMLDMLRVRGERNDNDLVDVIRASYGTIPILLATRHDESPEYRRMMLDAGVDGCIQVPFSPEELLLRAEKLLKKMDTLLFEGTEICVGNVRMNMGAHQVEREGETVNLTRSEYSILFHLFLHKNSIVSYEELGMCVHEEAYVDSSRIGIHIHNLRKKIRDTQLIRTVPLYGYKISENFTPMCG